MGELTCTAVSCTRTDRIKLGLCGKHYQRFTKYGSTDLPQSVPAQCGGPACERAAGDSGLCRSHYKQRHLGKPLAALQVATKDLGRPPVCTFEGCSRPHKARGFCKAHNHQAKQQQQLRTVQEYGLLPLCIEDGCGLLAVAKGLCPKHRQTRYDLAAKYNITLDFYLTMLEEQGGVCAICSGVNENGYRLSVDHDHACCPGDRSCGRCVRALLCAGCNYMIGHAKDLPDRLRAGAKYIETHARRELRLM